MSLKYGLNVKKSAPAPSRKTIFDDEDGEEDAVVDNEAEEIDSFGSAPLPPSRKLGLNSRPPPKLKQHKELDDRQDLSSAQASQSQVKAAEEIDPSIFDYDSFHDAKAAVTEAKKEAARQDAIKRKPKYINNLLDAAAKRKQDQLIAREKLLQKEREAEGDEFADKEKFVTGAYKQQQEEARRLEEEETKKAEEEERRKRQLGGGMQGFYRGMMEEQERQHQEAMDAAAKMDQEALDSMAEVGKREKSDAELAAELKAKGINIHVNEEGQITDKRELLSAGLNVASSGKSNDGRGSDHLKSSARSNQSAFTARNDAGKQAQRERQSRMMEEQLAAQAKRAREEEEEERLKVEKAAKSTKTEKDVSDAKARYLARKAAKERGDG
jgi:coiled-coil domain-containing protein 55